MLIKIMVVDNDAEITNSVKIILEREGYTVMTASNGTECLEKLMMNSDRTNLVLLDIAMPDFSGWDVYERIREQNEQTKVIFIGNIDVSEERKNALLADGVSDYITTPFTKAELLERVKRTIS